MKNITWHNATVTRSRRESQNGHRAVNLWFTGLSGSGKSTIAHALEEVLHQRGCRTIVLDGDNVRHGLCSDLGFGESDRRENIRRIAEVAKLFLDAGVIVLTAFISPYRADRQRVRELMGEGDFVEVHVSCGIDECERRDVKGLYKRARAGEIPNFTGISSPYEVPEAPELVLESDRHRLNECVTSVLTYLEGRGILQPDERSTAKAARRDQTGETTDA